MTSKPKRDWRNFFSAEDFDGPNGYMHPSEAAEHANALLKKAIEESPRVYGNRVGQWDEVMHSLERDNKYTAFLVCIEEIARGQIEREKK